MDFKEIMQSWINLGYKKEDVEKIAAARRKVCDACPERMTMLGVDVCGLCHCPLAPKTRSPKNSCHLKKWKQ